MRSHKAVRPTPARADREPRGDLAGRQIDCVVTPNEHFNQAPLRAELVGSDQCAAEGERARPGAGAGAVPFIGRGGARSESAASGVSR